MATNLCTKPIGDEPTCFF